jgi:DNA-binding response OmpR family regulator
MEADATLRDVLVSLFRSKGIEVVFCSSLLEVLRATDGRVSDVAIVDVSCGSFAERSDLQQQALRVLGEIVPLVVLTNERSLQEVDPCEVGATAILSKPFDLDFLLEAVTLCRRNQIRSTSAERTHW